MARAEPGTAVRDQVVGEDRQGRSNRQPDEIEVANAVRKEEPWPVSRGAENLFCGQGTGWEEVLALVTAGHCAPAKVHVGTAPRPRADMAAGSSHRNPGSPLLHDLAWLRGGVAATGPAQAW